jgi:4-hydroxythreonine-4-phosphate dehydrogenase
MLPRIGITTGDPAGIGPEIAARAAADPSVRAVCEPVLYGPGPEEAAARFAPGVLSAEAGRAAHEAIVSAAGDARRGRIAAMATAPISKKALALAGFPWPGHTELLAHLCGSPRVAMMFHAEALRVVLATVHVPLRDVPRLLTSERLGEVMDLAAGHLPAFGFPRPRLAVAALNPHAGEQGVMGTEDDAIIGPAVASARDRGLDVRGPIPADTVFLRASRGEFDAVVACYHDQGLIPIKLLAFGQAVNVTLGLPLIRTSVDHGTAFDIAGRGVADAGSLITAVRLAAKLAGSPVSFGSAAAARPPDAPHDPVRRGPA